MIFYAVYTISTGVVSKVSSVDLTWDPDLVGINSSLLPGEAIVQVPAGASWSTGNVVNGEYVPFSIAPSTRPPPQSV